MAVALTCDIPHLVYPTMRVMIPLVWKQSYHDTSLQRKALTVAGKFHTVTLISAMGLSIYAAHGYTLVLDIVGILSCVYVSGVLPCALYLKQTKERDWLWRTTAAVMVATIFIGSVAFAYVIWYRGYYY